MITDEVRLDVPAVPDLVPVLRQAAANLASVDGFAYDRIEDVRIAIGEATRLMMDRSSDPGPIATGRITMRCETDGATLRFAVSTTTADGSQELPALSAEILDASCDAYRVDAERAEDFRVIIEYRRPMAKEG